MKLLSFCLFLFFPFFPYAEQPNNTFIVLIDRESGMFSEFNDVLTLLDSYEKGYFKGVHVNFDKGLYFDEKVGPNWWEYYCNPIHLGQEDQAEIKRVTGLQIPHAIRRKQLITYDRQAAHDLIRKYIHVRPYLTKKVSQFVEQNFKSHFVIGVHYRGTDKKIAAPRVKYQEVLKEIKKKIAKVKKNYRIFIATDEQDFIDYMKIIFPKKILYLKSVTRSKDGSPVHIRADSPYKVGEDAILDCLLLSKTDYLIRTTSNLSLWSTYFNPVLPFKDLNTLYILQ